MCRLRPAFLLCVVFLSASQILFAQQQCPAAAALKPVPSGLNIFTDQQESDFGDIVADSFSRELQVIDDDSLNRHLQLIGTQLIRYLPANQFRFRFYLIELPQANAFSLPGGRIYVSRKMVALARSDDEIAGVVAHELGHIVTHQSAITMTRRLRKVLGVSQVGDRNDIADQYHRLLDIWRTKPLHEADKEQQEQYAADDVALYAIARAGYAPKAFSDLFDRMEETHGRTGNVFSDFFGSTKPEQYRLRQMLRTTAALPAACIEPAPAARATDFEKWQHEVIAYNINARRESLPGLVFKQPLALPLRPDITNLRFSPDGKYILAQDDGGIHVLSRDPLSLLFFIDALDANPAFFSPDSKSVVFYTGSPRIEVWDIASQKRTAVHELVMHHGCLQTELSPDGNTLACLDAELTLSLLRADSGEPVFTRKNFYQPNYFFMRLLLLLERSGSLPLIGMSFSPDGRYFLAGSPDATLAFDLAQKREVPIASSIRDLIRSQFAFVDADRIAGVDIRSPQKSPVLRFPSGERLAQLHLSNAIHLFPATHGNYLLLGPLKEHPLGVMNLQTQEIFSSFDRDAGDIYDNLLLVEQGDGDIVLVDVTAKKTVGFLHLVQSHLGGIRALAVSDDLQWLALSTRSRGAVWDLSHNIRVQLVRGFQGGWFAPDHSLYADFPEYKETKRAVVHIGALGGVEPVHSLEKTVGAQVGPYFVIRKPAREDRPTDDWSIDVQDLITGKSVWSSRYPHGIPALSWNTADNTVFESLPVYSKMAQEELKLVPELKKKAGPDDFLLELLNFQKSTPVSKLVVETNKGSFLIDEAIAEGDWAAVSVTGGRVLTYLLSSGEPKGHVFGTRPVLCGAAGLLAVQGGVGELNVYKLATSELQKQYKFPAAVAYDRFSPDGKKLFVLTRDQTAYVLDLTAM